MSKLLFTALSMRVAGEITEKTMKDGTDYLRFTIMNDYTNESYSASIFNDERGGYCYRWAKQHLNSGNVYNMAGEISGKLADFVDEKGIKRGKYQKINIKVLSCDYAIPEKDFSKIPKEPREVMEFKLDGFGE